MEGDERAGGKSINRLSRITGEKKEITGPVGEIKAPGGKNETCCDKSTDATMRGGE